MLKSIIVLSHLFVTFITNNHFNVNAIDLNTSIRFEKVFNMETRGAPFHWTNGLIKSSQPEYLKYLCEKDIFPYKKHYADVEAIEYSITTEYLNLQPESAKNFQVELLSCKYSSKIMWFSDRYATSSILKSNEKLTPVLKTYDGYILSASELTLASFFAEKHLENSREYVEWSNINLKDGYKVMCMQKGHTTGTSIEGKFKLDEHDRGIFITIMQCEKSERDLETVNFVGLNDEHNKGTKLLLVHRDAVTNEWFFDGEMIFDKNYWKSSAREDVKSFRKLAKANSRREHRQGKFIYLYDWGNKSQQLIDSNLTYICSNSRDVSIDNIIQVKTYARNLQLLPYGENRECEILECQYKKDGKNHITFLVPITNPTADHQTYREVVQKDNLFFFKGDINDETTRHEMNMKFMELYGNQSENTVITWTDKKSPRVVLDKFCDTTLKISSGEADKGTNQKMMSNRHMKTEIVELLLEPLKNKHYKVEILECVHQRDEKNEEIFTGIINPYFPKFLIQLKQNFIGFYEFDDAKDFTKKIITKLFLMKAKEEDYFHVDIISWITANSDYYENLMRRCQERRPEEFIKRVKIHQGSVLIDPRLNDVTEMQICACEFYNSEVNFEAVVAENNARELFEVHITSHNNYIIAIPNITVEEMFMLGNFQ